MILKRKKYRWKCVPGINQSPVGIFALISTFPYLNENESNVRTLALRIGLIIIGIDPVRSQPKNDGFEHLYWREQI